MLYEYVTLGDGTVINHSELLPDGKVRVFVEKWNDLHDDFDSLEIYFPSGEITKKVGFTEKECKILMACLDRAKEDLFELAAQKHGRKSGNGNDGRGSD